MTHKREALTIMDSATTFGIQNKISISRTVAVLILLSFIACLIATGTIAYYLKTCHDTCNNPTTNTNKIETIASLQCNQTYVTSTATTSIRTTDLTSTETIKNINNEPILTLTTIEPKTDNNNNNNILDLRLPKSIIPHSYNIKLIPFLSEDNFTFHGDVMIIINVTSQVDNITLHADDLNIDKGSIKLKRYNLDKMEDSYIPINDIELDKKRQFLIIYLNEIIDIMQYVLSIKFNGILNDTLQGLYRSSYQNGDSTRWIAATQFQPTDARKAFPCFDEPALKATFKISIARPKNTIAISNMPRIKSETHDSIQDYVWDHFQESVPMSTYLVAFVISDFDHITNGTFSVWSRSSAIDQSKYSLKIGPIVLKHYEDFFQIKFPLPKIDMIALPDFSAGAMENWGLITYRESVLLYQEGVSTRTSLQNIAIVVAHELAHQWFGNLVTPSWWSDLWLNEGFASYMEYIGTNAVSPSWNVLDQFVVHELQNVFSMDALKSSHNISVIVNNPEEINDIFDKISYGKGATIIRMMEHFLTTSVFKKGLTNYLNSRKYSSADQDDLWTALTEQARNDGIFKDDISVKEIMDTWTLQIGFPVVNVIRNYEQDSAALTQEKFVLETSKIPSNSLWWIPITYIQSDNNMKSIWMKADEKSILLNDIDKNSWLLLNVNQTAYYRVNYDDNNWHKIIEALYDNHKVFDPKNRAQLIDDSLNLASAGYLNYDISLNITKYLRNERNYVPWKAAFTGLDFINYMFLRNAHYHLFKKYMLWLLDEFYKDIGFDDNPNDPQLKVYNRIEILSHACKLSNVDCIRRAVTLFQNWKTNPNPDKENAISPNIKSVVYCNAIHVGGQDDWDFLWERYLNANVGSEKEIIMSALGCSREVWILSRYLEWAITPNSGIRKQDAARVFSVVSNNVIGQELTYRFLKANWDRIKEYMGASLMPLNAIIRACTSNFNTRPQVDDLKLFADSKKDELSVASRTIEQVIEQGEANIRWMNKYYDNIVNWLKSQESNNYKS